MSEDPAKLVKDDIDAIVRFLHRERDEIRVKLHLAKSEAQDEWHELEDKWRELRLKAGNVSDVAADVSHDVGAASEILAEEIKLGYARIKKALKDS